MRNPPLNLAVQSGAQLSATVAGHGATVVFLHGLGGFKELWAESSSPVRQAGFQTVELDLRGHGDSTDSPMPWTVADLANDLTSALDLLDVQRACLVGHSMGGRVLFEFALTHPERIWGLVVVGAQSQAPSGWYRAELSRVRDAVRLDGIAGFCEAFRAAGELPERIDRDSAYASAFMHRFNRNREQAIEVSLGAILEMKNLTGRLGEIAVPTLVVVGAQDRAFTEIAKHYEQAIPNCHTVMVADCTHYPMIDQPLLFQQTLLKFLDSGVEQGSFRGPIRDDVRDRTH
jgi:3-oxoadipate enol-lactonase